MADTLRRDLRLLKLYAAGSSIALVVLAVSAFTQAPKKARFTEIDVERINVVEPNGNYRLVLTNRPRSVPPLYKGKPFGYGGGTRAGIVFFNDEGTENGGLTFSGATDAMGKYVANSHLSFDQFNQDQVLYLDYGDENDTKRMGLTIADRAPMNIHTLTVSADSIRKAYPDTARRNAELKKLMTPKDGTPAYAARVFLGRNTDKSTMLFMTDPSGRPRIRMRVDSLGAPSLEFLNERGAVTSKFPVAP